MEHRARIRTQLRRVGLSAGLAALLVPAVAGTADAATHKKAKPKLPTITKVSPMRASIGETLTIRGKNFVRGAKKNTVIFMRDGGRPVFVKADLATAKLIKVKLPKTLAPVLATKGGAPVATRFRLRILAKKFGRSFTTAKLSPVIDPEKTGTTTTPGGTGPGTGTPGTGSGTPSTDAGAGDCDGDGVKNAVDTDDDNDLLPDTVEAAIHTDPCSADTDGDGVTDGYEYRSALDLNDDEYQNKATVPQNDVLPYPGKKPYPNPLDPTDANTDYDGDSLTQAEEFKLWRFTVDHEGASPDLEHLTYSDGTQYSLYYRDANGRRHPSQPAATYDKHQQFVDWALANGYSNVLLLVRPTDHYYDSAYPITAQTFSIFDSNLDGTDDVPGTDLDHNGWISDDERDEDADGLSNFDETHGRMEPGYWSSCYKQEKAYPVSYAGTDPTDADTDGDGIRDGADDQDHDDIPNVMELSRVDADGHAYIDWSGTECSTGTSQPPQVNHPDAYGRVNPFNPCLPDTWSRTCQRHPAFDDVPAPFDGSPDWWALN